MKKIFLSFLVLSGTFLSCSTEADLNETQTSPITHKSGLQNRNDNYLLKKKFAIALHEAMTNHQGVREFLKTEALKQFDGDYDILYGYVSDQLINGQTFRDILLQYFDSVADLEEIEATIPALTIFVPTLPENLFSASLWNTSTEIPLVAIRLLDNNKTPIVSSGPENYLMDANLIPGFPVVVVKECERIVLPHFRFYNNSILQEYAGPRNFRFRFRHRIFDFLTPLGTPPVINPDENAIVTAWNTYGQGDNLGWHRDYVYYTINPQSPNGPYINDYSEFIRHFKIEGATPQNALDNICNPSSVPNVLSDPDLDNVVISNQEGTESSFWTDGKFDFQLYIDYHAEQPELEKGFDIEPQDLFEIEYVWHNTGAGRKIGICQIKGTKTYDLNLEILPWKLHEYSKNFQFRFEELDLAVENSYQTSRTSKFNTNFSLEAEIWKLGIKLGGSTESTKTSTSAIKYTEQGNDLHSTLLNFGDNIIIGQQQSNYLYRRYNTGKCSFSLIPYKVQ